MNINKLLISLFFVTIATHLPAQTPQEPHQKMTLEQKLLILMQKLHLGERPWIKNGIIAVVPLYYLSHNVVALFNSIAQELPQLDLQSIPVSDISISLAFQTQTVPVGACEPCVELSSASPINEPLQSDSRCITPFRFGAMTAGLIFAYVVSQLCSQG